VIVIPAQVVLRVYADKALEAVEKREKWIPEAIALTLREMGPVITRSAKELAIARLRRPGFYPELLFWCLWGTHKLVIFSLHRAARIIEFGSRAHIILPAPPKKALRFFWELIEATVFFKRVMHPGTPKYRIVEDAILMNKEALVKKLKEVVESYVKA